VEPHAGFLGIGAYSVAIGPVYFGMPSWLSLFAGAVLSGIVAFLVGRPILRLTARPPWGLHRTANQATPS